MERGEVRKPIYWLTTSKIASKIEPPFSDLAKVICLAECFFISILGMDKVVSVITEFEKKRPWKRVEDSYKSVMIIINYEI